MKVVQIYKYSETFMKNKGFFVFITYIVTVSVITTTYTRISRVEGMDKKE